MNRIKTIRIKPYFRKNGVRVKGHKKKIKIKKMPQTHHPADYMFDAELDRKYQEQTGTTELIDGLYQHRQYKDVNNLHGDYIGMIKINPRRIYDKYGEFLYPYIDEPILDGEKRLKEVELHETLHHLDDHYYFGEKGGEDMNGEKGITYAGLVASEKIPFRELTDREKEVMRKRREARIRKVKNWRKKMKEEGLEELMF